MKQIKHLGRALFAATLTLVISTGAAFAQAKKPNIGDYPPRQAGASFNLSALKAELEKKMEAMKSVHGQ